MRLVLAVVLVCLAGPAGAQTVPQFRSYSSGPAYNGPHASPILASREAIQYRTRIRTAAASPVNFASLFHLEIWGCGTNCVTGAVVNAQSGDVVFLPFSVCCSSRSAEPGFNPIEFRPDSRLVIFSGQRNEEGLDASHFYEFTGAEFKFVTSYQPRVSQKPQPSASTYAATVGQDINALPLNTSPSSNPSPTPSGCWSIKEPTERLSCYDRAAIATPSNTTATPAPAIAPSPPVAAPPITVAQQPTYTKDDCEKDWRKCNDNEDIVNNNTLAGRAKYQCKDSANEQAKFGDPKWGWFPFGYFHKGTDYLQNGVMSITDKDAQFQNGFGAWAHVIVNCIYDLKTERVISVEMIDK